MDKVINDIKVIKFGWKFKTFEIIKSGIEAIL